MERCWESGEGFEREERGYFPAGYYGGVMEGVRGFPECGLGFGQRVRVVQYCRERGFGVENVLNSRYLPQILAIDSSNY